MRENFEIGRREHPLIRSRFVLMFSLLVLGSSVAYPKAGHAKSVVSNVSYVMTGLRVVVHYDLSGDPDAKYNVSLFLLKRSDPAFKYSPRELTGDIGLGKYVGKERRIVWNMRNEFPQGLQGGDFYFVVKAKEVEVPHASTTLLTWIGTGAAVIAAAVTYVIVVQNRGPGAPPSYPVPPGRPK